MPGSESGTDSSAPPISEPWADFLISHVRYADGRIDKVLAWTDLGATIAGGRQLHRDTVLDLLHQGSTFLTINRLEADARQWRPEAAVQLIAIDGCEFIRVDANSEHCDHLGELSSF